VPSACRLDASDDRTFPALEASSTVLRSLALAPAARNDTQGYAMMKEKRFSLSMNGSI